jgi:hypothetical protein
VLVTLLHDICSRNSKVFCMSGQRDYIILELIRCPILKSTFLNCLILPPFQTVAVLALDFYVYIHTNDNEPRYILTIV